MMAFPTPSERECQVGHLRVRFYNKRFRLFFFNPDHAIFFDLSCLLLMMNFSFLNMFCFSAIFADITHVMPRLSFTNVEALNYLLRFEIFVSEDRQLRAVHLILDFKPISEIYQEIGHAIRAGDQWLARINMSRPSFLAPEDLPPVAWPLQQILLETAIVPKEEIASSHLSLAEEIDKFHFKEEGEVLERPLSSQTQRLAFIDPPLLIP